MASVINQDLDPEQLKLFKSAMGQIHGETPATATAATPRRRGPSRKRDKRKGGK